LKRDAEVDPAHSIAPHPDSIAVLPFVNISADPEQAEIALLAELER
jgi:TolB-like protein